VAARGELAGFIFTIDCTLRATTRHLAGEFTEPNGKNHSLSFILSQMIGTVSLVATGRGREGMGSAGLPISSKRKCPARLGPARAGRSMRPATHRPASG
jgi:hypothetical protein